MQSNFVAKYLALFDNHIYDENGIPISTIKVSKDKNFFFEYKKPVQIYDTFSKEKILSEPDTVEIDYSDLERYGFIIISEKGRISERKSVIYRLCKKTKRIPKNANVLDVIPRNHQIIFDMANRIVKIEGPNSLGEWCVI